MAALNQIFPLIFLCLLGYVTIKLKLLRREDSEALARICFVILLPLFLFKSAYGAKFSADLSVHWFLSFYLPVIVIFGAVFCFCVIVKKHTRGSGAIHALLASYSNAVLIAIPVLSSVLPEAQATQGYVLIALHSAILFTLSQITINGNGWRAAIGGLKNPIVIGIFSGLLVNLLAVEIPELIYKPLDLLSGSAVGLALFSLGASMVFMPLKGNQNSVLLLSLMKLLALPALVYFVGTHLLDINETLVIVSTLVAASPTGAAAYLYANKQQQNTDVAATTVVLSTVLCPLSYLLWIHFLTT